MSIRIQNSPFRETAWDNRLDKMLDDLKTTVNPDQIKPFPNSDNHVISSYRNSSRSDSKSSNRVEDGGLMKHHHKEFTSPDKSTKIVTDQYEYDSGDPKKFQKKVMKSTYSSYNVKGDISSDLDALKQGPSQAVMDAARPTGDVQGPEDGLPHLPLEASGRTTTLASQNTFSRLNRNMKELDTMLADMDKDEQKTVLTTQTKTIRTVQNSQAISKAKVAEDSEDKTKEGYHNSKNLMNGRANADDEEVEYINDGTGGEVRRIVWRNRFDRTHETQDSSAPSMTIEDDARRHKHKEYMAKVMDISRKNHPNPPIPPIPSGGKAWADPIPLPTPPQVSPKEDPGVAYVYTYGQSGGTGVEHLPPLNYVPIPTGESGSTTPNTGNQPIIYHYSYHYNVPNGSSPGEGGIRPNLQPALQVAPPVRAMKPGDTMQNKGPVPTEFAYRSEQSKSSQVVTNENDRTLSNFLLHSHHHYPSDEPQPAPYKPERPKDGSLPRPGSIPRTPEITRRNINFSVNKTSSNYTVTHGTHCKDHPCGPITTTGSSKGPVITSTPYPNRDRSSSPDRRIPRDPHLYYCKTAADSLDRMRIRKPYNEPLPFPDTTPITNSEAAPIPRRIDDLMTSFSDSEDGIDRGRRGPIQIHRTVVPEPEAEPFIVNKHEADLELDERRMEIVKKDDSKNLAGPPVYYPPGHEQLFDESMHTMTLKENKRRGMAKWRNEKASGDKDRGSSSDNKGGMAMVPVCLPLCCGAACTIM